MALINVDYGNGILSKDSDGLTHKKYIVLENEDVQKIYEEYWDGDLCVHRSVIINVKRAPQLTLDVGVING